jgi:metal transporter CNNM
MLKIDFSSSYRNFGDDKFTFLFSFFFSSVKAHKILKRDVAVEEEGKFEIAGFRIEKTEKDPEIDENGIPVLRADTMVLLRLFGFGFNESTRIGLTQERNEAGAQCKMMLEIGYFTVILESSTNALVNVKMPKHSVDLYLCAATHDVSIKIRIISDDIISHVYFQNFIHQGHASWLQLKSHEPLLPTWVQVLIIMTCLCFSALFSGLNLGLMSLDRTDLKV